ncbi:hypothetical protein O7598_13165 [Micromonospora sp. WMMC241]|uniref:hypothetical protein n=1 Tax=Micromonospora sp. WMMC241 TaxID=3015159 RepID=UPI0022B6F5D4|nr:hypothetical protein [Micromonospora sp. WMMC241]MCZ7437349.1 hypothetical protein [Micromonospora sp. WMMC241]
MSASTTDRVADRPAEVTDPLLWDLSAAVADTHQPDAQRACASPSCAGVAWPCPAWNAAQAGLTIARAGSPGTRTGATGPRTAVTPAGTAATWVGSPVARAGSRATDPTAPGVATDSSASGGPTDPGRPTADTHLTATAA